MIETLEARRLLSGGSGSVVVKPNGTLTITGTDKDDVISISGDGFDNQEVLVNLNGSVFDSPIVGPIIQRIVVNSLGGNDQVNVAEGGDLIAINLGNGNNTVFDQDSLIGITAGNGNNTVQFSGSGIVDYFQGGRGVNTFDLTDEDSTSQPQTFDLNDYPSVTRLLNPRFNVICNDRGDYVQLLDNDIGHTVWGGRGNDSVVSDSFPDLFLGGRGDDIYIDANPNDPDQPPDTFVGGGGSDTIDYSQQYVIHFPVTVDLLAGTSSDPYETRCILSGVDNAIGGPDNDVLIGNGHDNVLVGGAGDDTITGNGGHDLLVGGDGNDIFFAKDKTCDTVQGGAGIDTVNADQNDLLQGVEVKTY